jgi:hypothetical protein
MDQQPLTHEEIQKLRTLLPLVETIKTEAEYTAARRIVLRTWKQTVIGIATVIGALVLLREQFKAAWNWLVGG